MEAAANCDWADESVAPRAAAGFVLPADEVDEHGDASLLVRVRRPGHAAARPGTSRRGAHADAEWTAEPIYVRMRAGATGRELKEALYQQGWPDPSSLRVLCGGATIRDAARLDRTAAATLGRSQRSWRTSGRPKTAGPCADPRNSETLCGARQPEAGPTGGAGLLEVWAVAKLVGGGGSGGGGGGGGGSGMNCCAVRSALRPERVVARRAWRRRPARPATERSIKQVARASTGGGTRPVQLVRGEGRDVSS